MKTTMFKSKIFTAAIWGQPERLRSARNKRSRWE
jgi:hypothetical protein